MEKVLNLHDSSKIQRFELCCHIKSDGVHIITWISAAVSHKVEYLVVKLDDVDIPFMLPPCLFTCESIELLELKIYCIVEFPLAICLTNLTDLILEGVVLPDNDSIQKLFSGCPVLEKLVLENCNWGDLKAVTISAPKLCILSIFSKATGWL